MAPSREARERLAELGVVYSSENLVKSDDIDINYDRETRMLIPSRFNGSSHECSRIPRGISPRESFSEHLSEFRIGSGYPIASYCFLTEASML